MASSLHGKNRSTCCCISTYRPVNRDLSGDRWSSKEETRRVRFATVLVEVAARFGGHSHHHLRLGVKERILR
jgi:hypothetical protein